MSRSGVAYRTRAARQARWPCAQRRLRSPLFPLPDPSQRASRQAGDGTGTGRRALSVSEEASFVAVFSKFPTGREPGAPVRPHSAACGEGSGREREREPRAQAPPPPLRTRIPRFRGPNFGRGSSFRTSKETQDTCSVKTENTHGLHEKNPQQQRHWSPRVKRWSSRAA